MHAPMPHSQPPRPLVQTSTTGSPQSARPPAIGVSPQQQQNLPQAGRDSPYLDPQVREARSSQPEEAWPLVGEEELQSREKLQDAPSSSSTGPLPTRLMFPFGIPPATPDQAMSMMRQAHMAPHHRPPRLPGTANPAAVPVSMQQVFPFLFAHQPFPTPQPHPPHLEVETESKEVQTAPAPEFLPPPPMKDQEVDVRPATSSRGIQCGRVNKKEMKTQTDLGGIDMPLLLTEDIKPPTLDEEAMGKPLPLSLDHNDHPLSSHPQIWRDKSRSLLCMLNR